MNAIRLCGTGLALCASLALGCSGEPRPKAEPAPEAPLPLAAEERAASSEATAEDAIEPTPEELPVREDFEAEAAAQITAENFRAELDKLEQEIAAAER